MGTRWSGTQVDADTTRLEAFSDGVFAIAITLLVLEVHVVPRAGETLLHALGHALPTIGAYAATFLVIGIMWANHHALFRLIGRADQLLLLWNILLLGLIAFLPVPTGLIAEFRTGADGRAAYVLYGGTLVLIALAFNLVWRYAVGRGLLVEGVSPVFIADVHRRYVFGPIAYVVVTLVALLSPVASLAGHLALALFFLLGPSPHAPFPATPRNDHDGVASPLR